MLVIGMSTHIGRSKDQVIFSFIQDIKVWKKLKVKGWKEKELEAFIICGKEHSYKGSGSGYSHIYHVVVSFF
jgi:hypothetical protein